MTKLAAVMAGLMLSSCLSLSSKPLEFQCDELGSFSHRYSDAPVFKQLVHDGDIYEIVQESPERETEDDPIYEALSEPSSNTKLAGAPRRVLLLSGGGQWGAYGAGFLNKMHEKKELGDLDIIAGVSTGALQALLAAIGDYHELENEYLSLRQDQYVDKGNALTVINQGYLYNPEPLRARVEQMLCESKTKCSRIKRLAESPIHVFVGAVELATGKFIVVDVSKIARAAYGNVANAQLTPKQAQQCISGAVLGSSAVPVFMRPARIASKTYVDGGVRYSVFEANIAHAIQTYVAKSRVDAELLVVRNGPTTLKPDVKDKDQKTRYAADVSPDAGKSALRSYATIVNQNEVMSIAALRLVKPSGPILFTSANGYYSVKKCERTVIKGKQNDDMFDPGFMKCLAEWGAEKATKTGWQKLCEPATPGSCT